MLPAARYSPCSNNYNNIYWIRSGNYFGGEPIGRAEVEMRVGKFKNGKAAVKDEITGEMIEGGGDRMVDWIWRLYMASEIGVVSEDWRSAVTVPLHKGKGERTECKNYRGISSLSVVRKIYTGILVNRVRRMTGDLIDDEQGALRAGSGCVDEIFTPEQIGEKAREKERRVYVGFIDLEKAYDTVNREALWQVLRMYEVGGKRLRGISIYIDSSTCVRVKGVKVSGLR